MCQALQLKVSKIRSFALFLWSTVSSLNHSAPRALRALGSEEGVQAYGGSYSSVTYSGNICNAIGVMRFPCNEVAMSDGFEKQNLAPTVPKTVHANDVSLEIYILLVVKSLHSSRDCWTCSRLCVRTL